MGMAICGFVGAGCGGDEQSDAERESARRVSSASEPPDVFAVRMANLLETASRKKDCPQLDAINARSLIRFPCPVENKGLRTSMARFKVLDAAEYGTGAVVDYKSGEVAKGASIVLFAAPDRNWGLARFGVVSGRTVGTSDDETRDGFDKAVAGYLAAVEKRDCKAYNQLAVTKADDDKAVCKTEFPSTAELAKKLEANPSARPSYEGGNSVFGFYTLETSKPEPANVTISVVKANAKSPQPYVVLDVAPSPTAAAQERFRRGVAQQRKSGGQPAMSPSRKADDS